MSDDVRTAADSPGPTEREEITPTQVLAQTLKRLYPQNPDVVLGREARVIMEAFEQAGFVAVATNDTRAHAMSRIAALKAEIAVLRAADAPPFDRGGN